GIARSAVWDGQIPDIMFQKALHRVRPLSCLDGHFLTFFLWVYERDEILQRYYTGAGIPHFTGKALARVTFPLPPLAEQRRIVAKVGQLMALVDTLETQLAASRATAANLLSALVAELTAAKSDAGGSRTLRPALARTSPIEVGRLGALLTAASPQVGPEFATSSPGLAWRSQG
ncbi:MAG TPA: restriction endonuclease subunit S, partial [Chthoniobacteraceae bacterium]|nr:restriction endonuclease subunit S [Chthoniobacteraceae bacterium]